jgi:hypothetical protein
VEIQCIGLCCRIGSFGCTALICHSVSSTQRVSLECWRTSEKRNSESSERIRIKQDIAIIRQYYSIVWSI